MNQRIIATIPRGDFDALFGGMPDQPVLERYVEELTWSVVGLLDRRFPGAKVYVQVAVDEDFKSTQIIAHEPIPGDLERDVDRWIAKHVEACRDVAIGLAEEVATP